MPDAVEGSRVAPSLTVGADAVTDNVTKLIWQRNIPTTYSGCTAVNARGASRLKGEMCSWIEAQSYCTSIGWRLPTKIELESILDQTRTTGAVIDAEAFPETPREGFWTSVPYAGLSGFAWSVSFSDGFSRYDDTALAYFVRCVR